MAIRIIISGGGTGGHVFPALAIADAVKSREPQAEILFVGAKGKIEMERVPKAGYPIKGLWISGFQRKLSVSNLLFPFKLADSLLRSWGIIRQFKPQAVAGVGGYASGPLLEVATRLGTPALLQEQNSYAGVTNRLLAKRAATICVAYEHMERFFPRDHIVFTGNPVRQVFQGAAPDKAEAKQHFGMDTGKQTICVFGGSMGALSINQAMASNAEVLAKHPEIQVLWQMGKLYETAFRESETARLPNVKAVTFVDRMELAYAMADLVICRAGALTISELALLGKAALLIPSPNVAEDHQTKNALALVEKEAAVLLPDEQAEKGIIRKALALLEKPSQLEQLGTNIKTFARPNAADEIATELLSLARSSDNKIKHNQ